MGVGARRGPSSRPEFSNAFRRFGVSQQAVHNPRPLIFFYRPRQEQPVTGASAKISLALVAGMLYPCLWA